MAEISSLREAYNAVNITGELKEKNLAKKTNEKTGENYISGNLVISYGENKEVKVGFYANEFKKRKSEEDALEVNKIYKGLETVINEFVSKAEVLRGEKEGAPSIVTTRGKISSYDGIGAKTGDLIHATSIKANFVERTDATPDKFGATFSTELYLTNIEKEVKEDVETGRVIVEGVIPVYGGQIVPIKMYTTTDESRGGNVGEYILSHYEVGKTTQVNGEIECTINHREYVKKGMFGETVQTFDTITTEFIIVDGLPEPYLITDPKHYDKNTIKAALLHREEYLDNLKAKNNQTNSQTMFESKTPLTTSTTLTSTTSNDFEEIDLDVENLEF